MQKAMPDQIRQAACKLGLRIPVINHLDQSHATARIDKIIMFLSYLLPARSSAVPIQMESQVFDNTLGLQLIVEHEYRHLLIKTCPQRQVAEEERWFRKSWWGHLDERLLSGQLCFKTTHKRYTATPRPCRD